MGKEMAAHPSILTWKIPWTEKPGGLQFMGPKESDTTYQFNHHHCVCAKSLQSCPTLSDPMDCSPPGSSVHGILTYVCVSVFFFRFFSLIGYYKILSRVPCAVQQGFSSEILSMYTKHDPMLSSVFSVLTYAFFHLLQLQLEADRV